jgi:Fe-S-cluster containining protein
MTGHQLVQIVDRAMAEAARKSGDWLACRPGCFECCLGPFAITQIDAIRLREGLAALDSTDPERAARVRERAHAAMERIRREFPENPVETLFAADSAVEEDQPCPALDPQTHTCDLYDARPITCRTFGPAVRFGGDSVGVCELCYRGATDEQIASCEVEVDTEKLEAALLNELAQSRGLQGETIVAFALANSCPETGQQP